MAEGLSRGLLLSLSPPQMSGSDRTNWQTATKNRNKALSSPLLHPLSLQHKTTPPPKNVYVVEDRIEQTKVEMVSQNETVASRYNLVITIARTLERRNVSYAD
jgi:hypothetical protein